MKRKKSRREDRIIWLINKVRKSLPEEFRTVTRILKLIYLIDWVYSYYNGHTFTEAKWYYHHYGPFSREIYNLIKEQSYNSNVMPPEDMEKIEPIIEKVVSKYGTYDFDELIELVYSTPPMKRAYKGDELLF